MEGDLYEYFQQNSGSCDPDQYMVLPEALISRYIDNANFYSNTASACEQYALAKLWRKGILSVI